jgi:putative sporulation protein YyaC
MGIVNVSGWMESTVLQNTRLNLVMKMADIISRSIFLELN